MSYHNELSQTLSLSLSLSVSWCCASFCRLIREYESQQASEGELTEQDMPADLLAGVETNQNEDDRSAAMLKLWPLHFLGHMAAEGQIPAELCPAHASACHTCLLFVPSLLSAAGLNGADVCGAFWLHIEYALGEHA